MENLEIRDVHFRVFADRVNRLFSWIFDLLRSDSGQTLENYVYEWVSNVNEYFRQYFGPPDSVFLLKSLI